MTSTFSSAMDGDAAEVSRPSASRHDPESLGRGLAKWLASRVDAPEVTHVEMPTANGMSSETVLFDATWRKAGKREEHHLVARLAPGDSAMPVFPSYDLGLQFATMRAIGDSSLVPVPVAYWYEPSPEPLGSEFLVMERATGKVPPDVMPYNFDSWVTEASEAQRARMQDGSVRVVADLHAIRSPERVFSHLLPAAGVTDGSRPAADAALRAHVADQREYYEWVTEGGARSELIERGFDWIDEHWPVVEGPSVFCWGDSRIGNIMYRDFAPAAVLDWEMATFGPRELDLGWMIFLHRFFEDIAATANLDGLPSFLRRGDVAGRYRELSGYQPRDLDFYTLYAALRHAIVMFRVARRAIEFGQAPASADPDDMILHRATLERMLDGAYWAAVEGGTA